MTTGDTPAYHYRFRPGAFHQLVVGANSELEILMRVVLRIQHIANHADHGLEVQVNGVRVQIGSEFPP